MDNKQEKMEQMLKETFSDAVQRAYIEGAKQGSITTAAILYNVLAGMGLEETNVIFDILKDIANKHGCTDLKAECEKIKNNTKKSDSSHLS